MNTTINDYLFIPDIHHLIETIQPESIISRTAYSDSQLKVVIFGFDTGQALSEHTAAQPAIIHILQGEATLTVAGETTREVSVGAWIHMPPHTVHSVVAKTPLILLLTLLKATTS